jgi:hypothetical protein
VVDPNAKRGHSRGIQKMKVRYIMAFAALAAGSQLLHAAPASATTIAQDRRSTDLVARMLGDARSARLALVSNDTAVAKTNIRSALAVRDKLARLARAEGQPMVVQIYTELDENADLSSGFTWAGRAPNETRANHIKALELTYFAVDLDKTKARLDAAQLAVRGNNDPAAEKSLAAIRGDLIHGNSAADVPLLTARRALALAQSELAANRLAAASADINEASASLRGYSSVGHTAAARQLATDIHATMPLNAQRGQNVSTKIDAWWSSLKTWFSQHA